MQFNNSKKASNARFSDTVVPPAALQKASEIVRNGGLIAYPTETFYGLGVSIERHQALERLMHLKTRPDQAPLSLLVTNLEMVKPLCDLSQVRWDRLQPFTDELWPGPVTIVVPARDGVNDSLIGPSGGIAARVSSHPVAHELVDRVGAPITATSANYRGEPPPTHHDGLIHSNLCQELDFILEAGKTHGERPSTILELRGGTVLLIRSGAVGLRRITRVAQQVGLSTDWVSRP